MIMRWIFGRRLTVWDVSGFTVCGPLVSAGEWWLAGVFFLVWLPIGMWGEGCVQKIKAPSPE